MKDISIRTRLTTNGFHTSIDGKDITTLYPSTIWRSVRPNARQLLAETITYFATRHLALSQKKNLSYLFAPPPDRLLYDYGLFYSMAEAPFEFPGKNLTTEGVLRSVYNSEFGVRFSGLPRKLISQTHMTPTAKTCVMPISFGKDSLLTFALARELDLKPKPAFFLEPWCTYQNKKKLLLRRNFEREFSVEITPFHNRLGTLREPSGLMWGWDMLLLQYTALMVPFVYSTRSSYFFWSNEQSTNEHEKNKEGYIINSTHEQSVQWTLHLSNFFRQFGLNTTISSLLEPAHELLVLWVLHKRYPKIAKYQLSCDGERTRYRWCGNCFECARVYLFFSALGIDPKSVGLMDNMFASGKRDLFYLFSQKNTSLDIVFQSYPERLLAFYLAIKRGARGPLVEEFKRKLLPMVRRQKHKLFAKYFNLHESFTIPKDIKPSLYKIYSQELKKLRREIS